MNFDACTIQMLNVALLCHLANGNSSSLNVQGPYRYILRMREYCIAGNVRERFILANLAN